ncbi:MAG: hypothetical protein LQ348_004434 [Seirophora lacunosa]|nr:MAG: hypothetical protein LQ348_004434 [Seirophora lacunosa]
MSLSHSRVLKTHRFGKDDGLCVRENIVFRATTTLFCIYIPLSIGHLASSVIPSQHSVNASKPFDRTRARPLPTSSNRDLHGMDFSSFEEPLFAFNNASTFDASLPSEYLEHDNDSIAMEALLNDETWGEDWLVNGTDPESSIDSALLTTIDPSLEPSNTSAMWDPSTSSEWQPLDPYTNIDPALLALDDLQIDPFSPPLTGPYYDTETLFAKDNEIVFLPQSLEFTASSAQLRLSPEVPSARHLALQKQSRDSLSTGAQKPKGRLSRGRPGVTRRTPKWSSPYAQPLVDGSGCPCQMCKKGGPVDISSLRTGKQQQQQQQQKRVAKPRATSQSVSPTGAPAKRKAEEMATPEGEDTSDSELSSLPSLSEDETSSDAEERALSDYEPKGKGKKSGVNVPAPPKRRRVVTRAAGTKMEKVPKGLEIEMRGW